jgi:hypothetical protein
VAIIYVLALLIRRWPAWVRLIIALPGVVYLLWGAFTAQHLGSRIVALILVVIPLLSLGIQAVREQSKGS